MSFANRVVGRLEQVQALERAQAVDVGVRPDFQQHYRRVVEMLSQVQQSGKPARKFVERTLRTYTRPRLERFVDELHWGLLSGFARQQSAADRAELVARALVLELDLEDGFPFETSIAWRHALRDVAADAWSAVMAIDDLGDPGHITRYCEAVQLLAWSPSPALTTPGRTLLGLRGSDVLRWLLALEVEQATGSSDPLRLHPSEVGELFRFDGQVLDGEQDDGPDIAWGHVRRLATMGLVTLIDDEYEVRTYGLRLTELGRDVLGELGSDTNPFQLLARAFVEDANQEQFDSSSGRAPGRTATDATLRHARMVAHEIRNALLPVRAGLRSVWKSLEGTPTEPQLSEARKRIDGGIERVYAFVERSVRLVDPSRATIEEFELVTALDEARVQLDAPGTVNLSIGIAPAGASPRCHGSKDRFVVAILNLMRNAVQVGASRIEVGVAAPADGHDRLMVTVDDDGPGIAPEDRQAVLENGVTGRAEGAGHGLTVVKQIVADDFGGTVSIDASHLGGAKFTLELNVEGPRE